MPSPLTGKTAARSWLERHYGCKASEGANLKAYDCEQLSTSKLSCIAGSEGERNRICLPLKPVHRKLTDTKRVEERATGARCCKRQLRTLRPPLSAQLAAIGEKASAITRALRPTNRVEGMKFALSTRSFVVGALVSKLPSPVLFFDDRCEYSFYHPYEPKEIRMLMFYKDMHEARVLHSFGNAWSFQFKIQRDLFHYGSDYQYRLPNHHVSVSLNSGYDAVRIKEEILCLLKR